MFLASYQKFYNLKFIQMDNTKKSNVNNTSTKQHDAKLHASKSGCDHKNGSRIVFGDRYCAKCGAWFGKM